MINWNLLTKDEMNLIQSTTTRAANQIKDTLTLSMDICAVHISDTPLDLYKLLRFDDFSFYHDINGIQKHIDRATGKLLHGFVPRCSKPKEEIEK